MDWGVIFATLAGVLAIQVQKLLERRAEEKRRKEWVFYTLMSLRASRLSADFVRALNTIDFAFSAGKPSQSAGEREVILVAMARRGYDKWLREVNARRGPEAIQRYAREATQNDTQTFFRFDQGELVAVLTDHG
jgi:hypothetical protein